MNAVNLDAIRIKLKSRINAPLPNASTEKNKSAAVLIPFAYHHNELVILFTHRSSNLISHHGQVSFPGGMAEVWDKSFTDTALRETQEEIGIQSQNIEVLGSLNRIQTNEGIDVFPFVGFINDLNGLHKNLDEVERIFCIPYTWIIDPGNLFQEDYQTPIGEMHKVWTFRNFEGEKIWGITANITRQLIDVLKKE